METNSTRRYTTLEIAKHLHCGGTDAVRLLRAANIQFTRCGQAYLWDAGAVDALLQVLNPERRARTTTES